MKIVVLDGHTLNPGDLSWDGFKALGTLKVHERTGEDDIITRAGDAEAVLTNKTPLNRESIRKITHLKYIGILGTGHGSVNIDAATKRGVVVTHAPDYATASVAQHVFALLMDITNHVSYHAYTVRKGQWSRGPDFCYWGRPLTELAGQVMGIIGLGKVGRRVADIAKSFGMTVVTFSRGGSEADLERIFKESDVVSLHCPLTPETKNIVNSVRLELMKPTAILINTSHGGLVDEQALAAALDSKKIGGAALDVLGEEPPEKDNPLFRARNCLITPHNAWATKAARQRLLDITIENLKAWQQGNPVNVLRS